MKHILDALQFSSREEIQTILDHSKFFKNTPFQAVADRLKHKVIATVFFEPSTRTRLSFESAAARLGANVIACENAFVNGSAAKGESIEDTSRVVSGYADLLVIRHPEKLSAHRAASVSSIPVINAGDGDGQHPTQALLDMYTIFEKFNTLDNLTITIAGDLKHSRTMHSTMQMISLFGNVTINLVSPSILSAPDDIVSSVRSRNTTINIFRDWNDVIGSTDVLYTNRIQRERFENQADFDSVKDAFVLTANHADRMKEESIIMNPLPRVNEILLEVDSNHRAIYFQQAANGLFVRMALLDMLLNVRPEDTISLVSSKMYHIA